jgi:hypothetical protein
MRKRLQLHNAFDIDDDRAMYAKKAGRAAADTEFVTTSELDSCRACRRAEAGLPAGCGLQGETKAGSPCAIFEAQRNERRQVRRPSERWSLGRFFCLGNGLGLLLRLGLGCELLLDLGRDGLGIYLVQGGGVPKHIRPVVT